VGQQAGWRVSKNGALERWSVGALERGSIGALERWSGKHGEEGTEAFTSGRAGQIIRRQNILHFEFQLVYKDQLGLSGKCAPMINWLDYTERVKPQSIDLVLTNRTRKYSSRFTMT
jgi:hypothetical protein